MNEFMSMTRVRKRPKPLFASLHLISTLPSPLLFNKNELGTHVSRCLLVLFHSRLGKGPGSGLRRVLGARALGQTQMGSVFEKYSSSDET